ncbi:hypothetical protein H5410_064045 [Solanum commersonii]|uniref:Uncharacterized protein n=1 Tax=Solanum commersonii TaxID=4109 RepID=A0A9J5W0Q9_SOLCO|nr:hypothetical protein H5410_064045 [Solanum commersonii]
MSTTGAGRHSSSGFSLQRERTDTTTWCLPAGTLPPAEPIPVVGRLLNVKDNSSRGSRRRLRSPNAAANRHAPFRNFNPDSNRLTHVGAAHMNLSPLRPSKFSFEYLLLPPRSVDPTGRLPPQARAFKVLQATAALSYSSGLALAPTPGRSALTPSIFAS